MQYCVTREWGYIFVVVVSALESGARQSRSLSLWLKIEDVREDALGAWIHPRVLKVAKLRRNRFEP